MLQWHCTVLQMFSLQAITYTSSLQIWMWNRQMLAIVNMTLSEFWAGTMKMPQKLEFTADRLFPVSSRLKAVLWPSYSGQTDQTSDGDSV